VRSKWYNDFVLACGVGDILGTCLIDTPSYSVIFGLHQQTGRQLPKCPILDHVREVLALGSLRQVESLFDPSRRDEGTQTMTEGVRYNFHVVNGRQYRDGVDKLLRTREEAIAHASVLARELAKDKVGSGSRSS
jgi:hypothetical protein